MMETIDRVRRMIIDQQRKHLRPLKELVLLPETYDRFVEECALTVGRNVPPKKLIGSIDFSGVKLSRLDLE